MSDTWYCMGCANRIEEYPYDYGDCDVCGDFHWTNSIANVPRPTIEEMYWE